MSTKGLVEVENGEFGRLEIKDCGDSKEGFLLMSGASKVRPMTVADSEVRSVLGPTGNKEQISSSIWKPVAKPLRKVDILPEDVSFEADNKPLLSPTAVASSSPPMHSMSVSSILRRQGSLLHSSLSLSASYSSDASSGSFHSRASMGRTYRTSSSTIPRRQLAPKPKVLVDSVSACSLDGLQPKKRCAWVTPSTDPSYGTFHDEEWGIPVHDDKKLFELLVLSGALAELTWPAILSKRHIFREVFADFDPITVSKFNEKKIIAPGSTGSSLLSEVKLRGIIENARQISKVPVPSAGPSEDP